MKRFNKPPVAVYYRCSKRDFVNAMCHPHKATFTVGLWVAFSASAFFHVLHASEPASFQKEVRPLLDTFCLKCHGAEKKKGGVDFSTISSDTLAAIQRKL